MIVMRLEEMQSFVKSVTDKKVYIKKVEEETLNPYAGHAYTDDNGDHIVEISDAINKGMDGTQTTKSFIRAFLLHEIGHISMKEVEEPHVNEYNAHMWAIWKAEDLGYRKVLAFLREEIISWQNISDTEEFKKYLRASQIYLIEQCT